MEPPAVPDFSADLVPLSSAPDATEQQLAVFVDDIIPTHGYHTLPVVGLGGSEGSLPALQAFFSHVAEDTGIAFVVVVHLPPEGESLLSEILQRTTRMPVSQVRETVKIHPNRVYVIPPGKHLSMVDGYIAVQPRRLERGKRVAVDLFFRTLADSHGPPAIA